MCMALLMGDELDGGGQCAAAIFGTSFEVLPALGFSGFLAAASLLFLLWLALDALGPESVGSPFS